MTDYLKQRIIFVVDDEPKIAKAIGRTIEAIDCKTRCFTSAFECLVTLEQDQCDLLVSDVNMPECNGLELLKRAKLLRPLLPVLMMSGYADIPMAVKAVKNGAIDFIEKPLDEITFLPLLLKSLPGDKNSATTRPITAVERKVLSLVATGLTNKEIAYELSRSIRTIENHRQRLMRKLGVSSTAELVKVAVTMGLTEFNLSHTE